MFSSVNSGKFENADRGMSKIKNGNNEKFVKNFTIDQILLRISMIDNLVKAYLPLIEL